MSILESVANRQSAWSGTANSLKLATNLARYTTFTASFLGALLAVLATFDLYLFKLNISSYLAALSAVSLGLATFVTARWLSKNAVDRHLRARLASEALKKEAFLYATHSGIYKDQETRDTNLLKHKTEIENNVTDLLIFEKTENISDSCPRENLDLNSYIKKRVDKQIEYFIVKSRQYSTFSRYLHTLELILSLMATLVVALAAVLEDATKWAAIAAALTTLAGIVVTHLESARYDKLAPLYRMTANQLENIKLKMQIDKHSIVDYILEFETILAAQNTAWLELWTKTAYRDENKII